jgi:hypothetical protein
LQVKDPFLWLSGDQVIYRFDSLWNITEINFIDPEQEFPEEPFHHFQIGDSSIAMIANLGELNRSTGVLRTIALDGDVATHDMNVEAVIESVDSTWYTGTLPIIMPHASVTVRLTNQGSETVQWIALNYWALWWICSGAGFTHVHDSLDLAPGESMLISFDNIMLGHYGLVSPSVLNQEVCIMALSPNHVWDRDMSNNLACDSAHLVVGVEEIGSDLLGISFVNPFADHLEGSFASPLRSATTISLFDVQGRELLFTQIQQGATRFNMNTEALADGPYLMTMQVDGRRVTRSVVKQTPR